MNLNRWVLSVLGATALAAATYGFVQSQDPGSVVTTKMVSTSSLDGLTSPSQDIQNFMKNMVNGTHLPTSITTLSNEGKVTARFTGLVMADTNERQVTITVQDEQADLTLAQVYLGGQLIATATVQNGGIVVRYGNALATISVLIPQPGQGYNLEVRWTASDSFVRSASIQASL
jgi:hypothetical protein